MFFAFKVEKMKKSNNIQTYKEIVAFMNGNHLDEITKHREEGKRIYQKILLSIGSGLLTIALFFVMILLFE